MTRPRPPPSLFRQSVAAALGLGVWIAAHAAFADLAGLDQLYAQRVAIRQADQRCHLFAPGVASALSMGEAQARNAALRAGASSADLKAVAADARGQADQLSCNDSRVVAESARVKAAFGQYARILKLSFKGGAAVWQADRTVLATRLDQGRWALSTTPVRTDMPGARLGLKARDGALYLYATPGEGPAPSAVRLAVRDPDKETQPYLTGGLTPTPRSFQRFYFATNRVEAPGEGAGFVLPDSALDALAHLDPREVAVVEFVYSGAGRDHVRSAVFEIGDFAAALGFLEMR